MGKDYKFRKFTYKTLFFTKGIERIQRYSIRRSMIFKCNFSV
jgi:hypothetical protein